MPTVGYTAIVGASSYAGRETLDRVLAHAELELYALGSDSLAGQDAAALDPRLARSAVTVPRLISNEEALASGADVHFLCVSHEEAARLPPPARGVVVDLSGAHRFADAALYEDLFGFVHPRPEELGDWAYALPEVEPPEGRLLAIPGRYATAALLALAPLREAVDQASVVVDAKCGTTGAGRTLRPRSHAGSVLENISPYRVGGHRHAAEIARVLGFPVTLVPHVLPVRRGLIASCYVRSTGPDLRGLLEEAYGASVLVTVLPEGVVPDLSRVRGTDTAELAVFTDRFTDRSIVICALDNLGKGAAGQAVQTANLALGFPEEEGLRLAGVFI